MSFGSPRQAGGSLPISRAEIDAAAADAVAASPAIARVDPGTAGSAGQQLAWNPQTGAPFWQKRRYILVDDYTDAGGTVADAITAVPASGGDLVFRGDGTYTVPNAGLSLKSNMRVTTAGSRKPKLTTPAGATGTSLLVLGSSTNITVENIELDLNGHATMVRGVYQNVNSTTYRDNRFDSVTVRNALGPAFYFWQSQGITLVDVQALDCIVGVDIVDVNGPVWVTRPRIVNTVAGRMIYGIRAQGSAAREEIGVEIVNPYISGADFATTNGSNAHGILIYRTRGAKIIGGTITKCGNAANKQGGGVVFSGQSHYGQIEGTHIHDNYANGLWLEVVPTGDVTISTDTSKRGISARGVRVERNVTGFAVSYGAGSHLVDCWAIDNQAGGFYTDSENVLFEACKAINNWTDTGAARPSQNGGVKAGFRAYMGAAGRNAYSGAFVGCDSIDNRTVQLQEYGFAAEDRGYRFVGNLGNGSLGAYSGGTTSNKFSANSW